MTMSKRTRAMQAGTLIGSGLMVMALALSACGTNPSAGAVPGAPTATAEAVVATPESPTPTPQEAATPTPSPQPSPTVAPTPEPTPTTEPTPTPTPTPEPLPPSAYLEPMTHAYQTWNNCAAVSTSMVLSYYGITMTQQQLGPIFRPNSDDKHVEPPQLVAFFPQYGLQTRIVEGGSIEVVKRLVAAGFPVITPQWLDHKPDAIGHYRVVRGYDDNRGGLIVNDSMLGPDVLIPYDEFEELWRAFNYRYLPVYRPEDEPRVLAILGEDADPQRNYQRALALFQRLAEERPEDAYVWFSIGTSYFLLGDYQAAVQAYERAEAIGLPPKMLWYQFWPVAAYNNIGNHQRALELATAQIATAGTFGEMRYERGRAFEAMGNLDAAIAEYRRALRDDANLSVAREALARLGAAP